MDSQIAAARRARRKVDEWLKKQENTFLKEINRQMGKNYTSFSTAQREYFKFFESRGGRYGPVTTAHRLEGGHQGRASQQKRKFESHAMEILALDRWRACGYCSRYDGVEVQGTLLGEIRRNKNYYYSQYRRSAIDDFNKSYYQNALADSEARGMDKLIKNGTLLNRLSNYRVHHYRRLGLQDKVFQMSAYLILTGAIRTNYIQYTLPYSLRKYNPPKYWDDDRLLKWGKDLAPAIPHERFIFSEEYLQQQIDYWTRIPIVRISRQKVTQKVERERQEVVEELLKKIKNWYLDLDGDGYHSKIHIGEESPGNKWKTTTKGLDCDDTNKNRKTAEDCEQCKTSKKDLKKMFPNTPDATLTKIADAINKYGKDFGIDTKEKLQHFITQAGHESNEFKAFEENLNYRWERLGLDYWKRYFNPITNPAADPAKANPNDFKRSSTSVYVDVEKFANRVYNDRYRENKIGNINEGDGYKFRGRGIFQLTGRTNYRNFNNFYRTNYDSSVNLINNPDLISTNKNIAVISALWFYKNSVLDKIIVDNNISVKAVTEKVNGGKNGLNHRRTLHAKTQANIDCL
ncbi:glycoside hydrolase family 19 protein [Allomuricauda sp. SCSIO 65647]|uniref:glycoside hydrolase family 19 protein n=1 Tax=Allomuricauda sp. SCSIO 65647 TaxID=2908843 RepID=UPI001F2046E6|nr:glycoside hydrolase family 19 protein [Muricauda sp. SCSIO 65647]UJH66292.1 hypothetical protein L0P89_09945 [Muricauda sp. SCSIO 65647]